MMNMLLANAFIPITIIWHSLFGGPSISVTYTEPTSPMVAPTAIPAGIGAKPKVSASTGDGRIDPKLLPRPKVASSTAASLAGSNAALPQASGSAAPALFGVVSSTNGSLVSIEAQVSALVATSTLSVDASSATVTKNGAAAKFSAIVPGDVVLVSGDIGGLNLKAKTIVDRGPMKAGKK